MHTRRVFTASLLIATALLATGCATAPPVASRMELDPLGTVTTYHRKSSGSLGTYDGQVVWTHTPTTWQGKPAVAFGSAQGASLLDPLTYAVLGGLGPDGKPTASYDPPVDYAWPMQVGKTWRSTHTVTLYPSGRQVPMAIDWKVAAWENVTVPAGTFKAYRVEWVSSMGETETRWIVPQQGIATVKRHVERSASHAQGPGVLDAELLSRVRAAR